MRLHFKDYTRVHGIITNGGSAHNSIPDFASCLFNIRALEYDELNEVIKLINNCADGSALSTGTKVEKQVIGETIKNVKNNQKIVRFVRENMKIFGEEFIERSLDQGIGSTDAGNVTHEIPAAQFYVKLDDNAGTHTVEFEEAAGDIRGERCLLQAIKISTKTGLDLLLD